MKTLAFTNEWEREPETETRYWSPCSEHYTTGDALLRALDDGFHVHGVIFREEVWHSGGRRSVVYHLFLKKAEEDDLLKMSVVDNPYVSEVVKRMNHQIVRFNERKRVGIERW